MLRIKYVSVLVGFLCFQSIFSQSVEITGRVQSYSGIENIHVINKTTSGYAITDEEGHFKIRVALNDTIMFSSIQHKDKQIVISKENINFKSVLVRLEERINELDEVVVGKVLTGDLLEDIKRVDGKAPINFYDVGIPGYTGRIKTQSERRLFEATGGGLKWYQPLTGSVPINPILNAITGRTKELKRRVKIETRESLMRSVKSRLAEDFFLSNPLDEDLRMDFFYFCSDDPNFITYCEGKTDFEILVFLRKKYREYQTNLESGQD